MSVLITQIIRLNIGLVLGRGKFENKNSSDISKWPNLFSRPRMLQIIYSVIFFISILKEATFNAKLEEREKLRWVFIKQITNFLPSVPRLSRSDL
jgi:hypothetical protein